MPSGSPPPSPFDGHLAFLRSVPVFGGLDDDEFDRVIAHATHRRCPEGEDIVREGDLAKEMFVILDGQVAVLKGGEEEQTLCALGRGDCFGEMALIDIQPRSATVRAATDTELLVLGFDDLIRIYQFNIQTYTIIVLNIAREISRRLRESNRRILELGQDVFPEP